jgi:small subunit ribosomal protein S8e
MKFGRKVSGGKYKKKRKKKSFESKGQTRNVKLGEEKKKVQRVTGGRRKKFFLKAKFVNVLGKNNEIRRVEIKNVLETPSNRFLARQNILTKGTIIETELGKVKITNRPSQEPIINGILIE